MSAFLNCIVMLKTVHSKKEKYVLKNIERHRKRSANLKKKDTVKEV